MPVEVHKKFFETKDQVLEDVKSTGFWPTTFVSRPSPPLDIHWHDLEVHAYVMSGSTWFLDAEIGVRHEVSAGDKLVIPARTLHAEGETTSNVIYIIALPDPGPFGQFLEQRRPEELEADG